MKSISTLFRQLFLIVVLISAFSLSAWGEEVTATLSFANKAQRTSFSTSKQVWEQNGITFTNNKASSTNSVADYANPVRLYANSSVVVNAPGNITKIVFDCNSTSYATTMKNSIGNSATASSDKVTVTLNGTTNSFTVAKLTAQVRLDAITVTYENKGTTDPVEPTPSLILSTMLINFGDVELNTDINTIQSQKFTISGENLKGDVELKLDNDNFSITPTTITPDDGNINQEIIVTLLKTTPKGKLKTTITISTEGIRQAVTLQANIYKPCKIFFGETEYKTDADGKVINFPSENNAPESCNDMYSKFFGWTTSAILGIDTERPTIINENSTFKNNTQLYPVYTKENASAGETWTLVTDASTLAVGDLVVIAAAEFAYALSTNQKTNNRGAILTTKDDNTNTIAINNNVQILTLEAGKESGTFAFNTGSGYLYAASSSANQLKTKLILDEHGSWTITIADNVASIVAKSSSNRNVMQYNPNDGDPLFNCYKEASQQDIVLYKKSTISSTATEYFICCNVVESDKTINIDENITFNTLTIKSYLDEAGQVAVTSDSLTAQKVVVEKTIDASRWFFFSLPFDCNVDDIVATYVNGGDTLQYAPNDSTGNYVITEYKGGWVELIGTSHTLNANQGYIIGHFESGDVTVKFPSADAQVISAPVNATLEKTSNNDFNLIGLPYFQKVTNVGLNTMHVSIPNEDGTYTQELCNAKIIASIAPFTSFFVQTEDENIEFTLGAQQNAAPRLDRRSNQASLHKAVVTLTDANGGADKTTIINNPSKTTDYEIGHDLTKLIGYASIPQIYSLQGDEMLAFNSLAIDNSTVIPLGVYAHADGEYTFSLSEKSVGDLEGWELYDNETGKTTRLANEDLTIYLEQGTHEGRFEIRLQQRISTNCDNTMGDMTTWTANGTLNINNMPTDAIVYIYDAVGRMIYVATPNATTFNYNFVARGVYNIVVRSADNTVSFKTIY